MSILPNGGEGPDPVRPDTFRTVRQILSEVSEATLRAVEAALRLTAGPPTAVEGLSVFLLATYLGDTERSVVLALESRPLKAEPLAVRLGLDAPTTQFRVLLAGLVERGILRVDRSGYVVDPRAVEAARLAKR
jgi:hypothetical protein